MTIIDEEIIIDTVIEAINDPSNDKYWIGYKPGTNYFTLRLEDGRQDSTERSKNFIQWFKN